VSINFVDQANALTTYLHYESTPPPTWRAESVGCPGTVVTARNVRAIHVTGFTGVVDCLSVWCGVRVTVDIAEDQTVLYDRQRTVTYVRTTPEKIVTQNAQLGGLGGKIYRMSTFSGCRSVWSWLCIFLHLGVHRFCIARALGFLDVTVRPPARGTYEFYFFLFRRLIFQSNSRLCSFPKKRTTDG